MKNLRQSLQIFIIILLNIVVVLPNVTNADEGLSVVNLRTEYKTNPIATDVRQPRMSWEIKSDKRNTMQTAYELRCALDKADLMYGRKLLWSQKVNSDQSVHIVYQGPDLESRQRVYWQVKIWDNKGRESGWTKPVFWEMGLLREKDWRAKWIAARVEEDTTRSQPAHYYRKEFTLNDRVIKARLYITSHGLYESFINGQRVGDQVFTPGWTSYNNRLQYQTYDITRLLTKGDNVIGVTLGDGWYRGYLGWKDRRNVYGSRLALLAQIEIEYADGTRKILVTDKSWRSTNDGPIIMSDIYMGEIYDARKEMDGWTSTDFNDSEWKKVSVQDYRMDHLVTPIGPPVRKIEEVKPKEVISKGNGVYIVDMGQNMVGWIRLNVEGKAGTRITLRHAEVLDKHGNLYTENLRSATQSLVYTCKEAGKEVYEPHFTFQGFRYVEIAAYPGAPALSSITGYAIHSDMTPVGNFMCSDSLINQLQHNIQWGLKGNFLDVPTDCPQRDERLGWTGDAQVFAPTACFNMDAASFYTKWLRDMALDQGDDGKVNDVIPDVLNGGGGHTGWADASVVVPWTVYLNYGDKRILENQYESMKAWIKYMKDRAGDNYLWQHDWHYGDWLSFDDSHPAYMGAYTETDLIATAYFAHSTTLLGKIADVLGKTDDAHAYRILANKIKDAFTREFVTPNGRLVSNTQTAYTLALAMGLLPESIRESAAENLYHNVNRFKHITTGFLGTPLICKTLSDNGYIDMAYLLLNRKKYPSWLYPVTMGATTIWERWDGMKPDSTFQNPGMNSLNHYAYGAIGKWLYSTVAGIDVDENIPGYKHIIIAPNPGGGLTHAMAEIHTIYGEAKSAWQMANHEMVLDVTIPPNTSADVYLPAGDVNMISERGKPIKESDHLRTILNDDGKIVLQIGSGNYQFKVLTK